MIANAGDSRAVLFAENKRGYIEPIPLSNDHKPDLEEEKKRIIKSGGRVDKYTGTIILT